MKRITLILGSVVVGLLMSFLVTYILAQDTAIPVVAKIPFEFILSDRQMPAGRYTIRHTISNNHYLTVRNEDNSMVEIACTYNLQSRSAVVEGKLIFNRYGDQYYLAEVWWPNDTIGHIIDKTEREKALIKELSVGDRKSVKEAEKVIIKLPQAGKTN
jgi:hypothetical protein